MTTQNSIPTVTAGTVGAPPAWAVLQRRLIETMNDAAPLIVDKFTERGGAPYYADDLDDLYEIFFGWGLFYAIGGNERVLDMALDKWNAVHALGRLGHRESQEARHVESRRAP